jgi:hypothetical protein
MAIFKKDADKSTGETPATTSSTTQAAPAPEKVPQQTAAEPAATTASAEPAETAAAPAKPAPAKKQAAAEPPPKKRGPSAVKQGSDAARAQAARIIRLVSVVLATVLALGALLVALKANVNQDNSIVRFITDLADTVSGPFSRDNGVFHFSGKNADAKNALVNWGIAAIVYLGLGRIVANVVAPSGGTTTRR